MITSSENKIQNYTNKGSWAHDTLHDLLAVQCKEQPSLLAVKDQLDREQSTNSPSLELSIEQLDIASTNLACQLLSQGISKDDVLLTQLPNIVELYVLYFAVSKIGAIISPVPIQYAEHELNFIAQAVKPKAVITTAEFKQLALAANVQKIFTSKIPVFAFNSDQTGIELFIDIQKDTSNEAIVQQHQKANPLTANDIFTICWTSGTTGTPKGVPRSHNMWIAIAKTTAEAGSYQTGDRLLNPFPMINMASLAANLYAPMIVGCSVILHHPMDPALFLKQMQDEKITFALAPPALLNKLAQSKETWDQFDFSALRAVGSGSAPLAPWMIETFENSYNKYVINFYGSNEGISLFSMPSLVPDPEIRASMFPRLGRAELSWDLECDKLIQTKLVDVDTGEEITEKNKSGELLIKGPTVFDGYFGKVEEQVFTQDGYFHTGDLLEICGDDKLYYRIVGRCKDIINRGGMKISPAELDVLLEGFPEAVEAAVCSYPDAQLGEKICACIVPSNADSPPSLAQVIEFLEHKNLAKFKQPERLELFEKLPRNPVGKIERFNLQDMVAKR